MKSKDNLVVKAQRDLHWLRRWSKNDDAFKGTIGKMVKLHRQDRSRRTRHSYVFEYLFRRSLIRKWKWGRKADAKRNARWAQLRTHLDESKAQPNPAG